MALRFQSRTIPEPDMGSLLAHATAAYLADDRIIIHAGTVAHADGDRAEAVREAATRSWEHAGPQGPLWVGGLAFHGAGTGVWEGFPAGRFHLPKRQWAYIDGVWTETLCEGPALPQPPPPAATCKASDPATWRNIVHTAKEAIRAGAVTKVVLARCDVAASGDIGDALLRLREANEGTGFLFSAGNTFFGCTPERLVRLVGGDVTTHALAGSTGRGDHTTDPQLAADLQDSGKDILEHELVVAFVRERLVEAGVQGVHQAERRLLPLQHVQHLETPIRGHAPPGTHVLELAASLHPTPAVCGTPRQKSLALIERLEDFPRGWYAGAVGWFDEHGEGELSVALRCALDTGKERYLFAGAGIVAGSEADAEWEETETKLAALRGVS